MFVDCGFGLIGFVGFGFASWGLCSVGCWVCLFWCSFTWFGCFNVGGGFLFDFVGVLVCGVSMLVWGFALRRGGFIAFGCIGLIALPMFVCGLLHYWCLFEYANWFDLLVCLWDGLGGWRVGLYCDVVVGFLVFGD